MADGRWPKPSSAAPKTKEINRRGAKEHRAAERHRKQHCHKRTQRAQRKRAKETLPQRRGGGQRNAETPKTKKRTPLPSEGGEGACFRAAKDLATKEEAPSFWSCSVGVKSNLLLDLQGDGAEQTGFEQA